MATTIGKEATLLVTTSEDAQQHQQLTHQHQHHQQQQQPNENPQQKSLKKIYALHIGPSKLGTSAIQKKPAEQSIY